MWLVHEEAEFYNLPGMIALRGATFPRSIINLSPSGRIFLPWLQTGYACVQWSGQGGADWSTSARPGGTWCHHDSFMIGATPIEAAPLFNELLPSNNIVGFWFSPTSGRVIAADGSNRVHEGILDWHAYRLGKADGKTAEDVFSNDGFLATRSCKGLNLGGKE